VAKNDKKSYGKTTTTNESAKAKTNTNKKFK